MLSTVYPHSSSFWDFILVRDFSFSSLESSNPVNSVDFRQRQRHSAWSWPRACLLFRRHRKRRFVVWSMGIWYPFRQDRYAPSSLLTLITISPFLSLTRPVERHDPLYLNRCCFHLWLAIHSHNRISHRY